MSPEEFQQVLWVLLVVKESKLVEVDILQKSLAGVNLGFVVLTFHKDLQKALCCCKREHFAQIAILIIEIRIFLRTVNIVYDVEAIDNF